MYIYLNIPCFYITTKIGKSQELIDDNLFADKFSYHTAIGPRYPHNEC